MKKVIQMCDNCGKEMIPGQEMHILRTFKTSLNESGMAMGYTPKLDVELCSYKCMIEQINKIQEWEKETR